MELNLKNASSSRFAKLAKKLRSKSYRKGYIGTHIKTFLSNQISALRGDLSQEEFGNLLGKPQSVVSRLQNPTYGKFTLQTLLDIADRMDVALIVRFVDYPTFLKFTNDFSNNAVRPDSYKPEQIDNLAKAEQEVAQKVPFFLPMPETSLLGNARGFYRRGQEGGAKGLFASSTHKEQLGNA